MSETTQQPGQVNLTKPVVATFLNLAEPKSVMRNGKPTGEPKYSINLEFPADHPDLVPLKAKAVEMAQAKWPGADLKTLAFPFANGNKLADDAAAKGKDREFSRGKAVLAARSKYQPRLSVLDGGKIRDLTDDTAIKAAMRDAFYSGVEVLAQVNFVAYDPVGNNPAGVACYINMVLSTKRGAKLTSGGASAAEVFKDYIGTTSDEDPTGGAGTGLDDLFSGA